MKRSPLASMVKWRIRRRFHTLERIGWKATRTSTSSRQTIVGVTLMLVGWHARTAQRKARLYRYTATPGESVRIRVLRGSKILADATVET